MSPMYEYMCIGNYATVFDEIWQDDLGERKGRREREGIGEREREGGEVNIMGRRETILILHSREIV